MKRNALFLCLTLIGFAGQAQHEGSSPEPQLDSVTEVVHSSLPPMEVFPDLYLLTDEIEPLGVRHTKSWKRRWHVGVDATTFLRDAAFSLPYTRGYTAVGYFLTPYVKHSIGHHARVTLGINLAGAAGYDGIRTWQPLVRLEYEPFYKFRLVMGSIYGTLTHGLYEPMLDRERYIYAHQEEGVQLLADYWLGGHQRWRMDTWLHWEDLLEPWQPKQERFTLGSSHLFTLYTDHSQEPGKSSFGVSVPVSFVGSHRGGQFSSLDTCIQSLFNESVGLRLNLTVGMSGALSLDVPVFFYQDISPTKCMAYNDGWAVWPHLSFDWWFANSGNRGAKENWWHGDWRMLVQAGYWQGHQYIAPRGSYLFQSVSWHRPDFSVPERRMVTAKLAFENRYNRRLSMGLDTEYYYDMREKAMDFAFGLYLRYNFSN